MWCLCLPDIKSFLIADELLPLPQFCFVVPSFDLWKKCRHHPPNRSLNQSLTTIKGALLDLLGC